MGSLCNSLVAVLETIFADNCKAAHLRFVLPKEVTATLGPVRISELQGSSGVSLRIRPPTPSFADEHILEGRGSLKAFTKLLPLLCASLHFPLPYQYGTDYEPPSTVHIDSSPVHASRLKRTRQVERANFREEKRSKQTTWGPTRGPGQLAGPRSAARGATRH